jgi:hypothetical protein
MAAAVATGLTLRHDHGSHDLSDDFQAKLPFFGMVVARLLCASREGTAGSSASSARSRSNCPGSGEIR